MSQKRVSKSKTPYKKKSKTISYYKKTKIKQQIKVKTLQDKWRQFVHDNSDEIRLHITHAKSEDKSDNAWYFATDSFFDELSQEYDSEMLKRRFEEIIFNDYCSHFMDELFQALDEYDCFEGD